jgi:hypothetical protein
VEFFAKRELHSTKALIIQEVDSIVLVISKGPYIYSNTILFLTALLRVSVPTAIGLKVGKKRVSELLAESQVICSERGGKEAERGTTPLLATLPRTSYFQVFDASGMNKESFPEHGDGDTQGS